MPVSENDTVYSAERALVATQGNQLLPAEVTEGQRVRLLTKAAEEFWKLGGEDGVLVVSTTHCVVNPEYLRDLTTAKTTLVCPAKLE